MWRLCHKSQSFSSSLYYITLCTYTTLNTASMNTKHTTIHCIKVTGVVYLAAAWAWARAFLISRNVVPFEPTSNGARSQKLIAILQYVAYNKSIIIMNRGTPLFDVHLLKSMESFELIMSQSALEMNTFSFSPKLPIDTISHRAHRELSPPKDMTMSGTTQIQIYCSMQHAMGKSSRTHQWPTHTL